MKLLLRFTLVVVALLAVSHWVPGIAVGSTYTAVIVALLLGVASLTIKPILTLLTLPIHFLTFGLSVFLINAFIFWFLATFVDGFTVAGFLPALIGSITVSLVASLASHIR